MMDYVAVLLIFLYIMLFLLGSIQCFHILNSQNRKVTIRSGIIIFLTLSSLLRIIFWIKVSIPSTWPNQLMNVIFFLPVWMQFSGLSLLGVFYLQSVNKEKTALPLQVHIVANFLFFCVCLIIALVAHDPYATEDVKRDVLIMYIVYAAFLDFLLVLLLGYLGHAFISTLNSGFFVNNRLLPRSPKVLMFVNWLLITSYTVRGVITLIVGFDTWQLPSDGEVTYNGKHGDTSILVFLFFLVTEITPIFCVILTMWKYQHRQSTDDPIDHKPRTSMVSIDDRKVKVHITDTSPETSNWWASIYAGWNNMRVDMDEENNDEYVLFRDPAAASPMHGPPPTGVTPLSLGSSPGIAAPSPMKPSVGPPGTAPSESIPIPPRTDVHSGLSTATPPSLENWLNTDKMTVSSPLRSSIPRSSSSLEGSQTLSARNRPLPVYPHSKLGPQLSREDPNNADSWNPSPNTSKTLMDRYAPPDLTTQPLHRPVLGGQNMFENTGRYESPVAASNESGGFFIGDPAGAMSHRAQHRTPTPPINVTIPQSHSKGSLTDENKYADTIGPRDILTPSTRKSKK